MQNKNSKSESYIVREAENVIERYLKDREFTNINKYYKLKEKYERLRIVTVSTLITLILGTLISVLIK